MGLRRACLPSCPSLLLAALELLALSADARALPLLCTQMIRHGVDCQLTMCRCSQADDFLDTLGGHGKEGGKRWRLVFNAGNSLVSRQDARPGSLQDRLLLQHEIS